VERSVGLKDSQVGLEKEFSTGDANLGRRRRRVIKVVKKKLPTVFTCPTCSEETVKVTISKGAGKATVRCASCGLKQEIDAPPSFDIIDVYCSFADKFYSKDRPASQTSEPAQVA